MKNKIKIGTRASPLALAQVELLKTALMEKHSHLKEPDAFEIVKIKTSGDKIQDRALLEAGGKGLFTKEIEEALLAGEIDCAVHSMKDMPTQLPDGLVIPCLLPREDPRDAFFSPKAKKIQDLPEGAVVGTASLRRQVFTKEIRPDLSVVLLRGNVGTRLRKLEEGEVDATYLAYAGLKRLGQEDLVTSVIEPEVMLPAAAQGAIGIELRAEDSEMHDVLSAVHCAVTELCITAERSYLAAMDGSCRTPIAALMEAPDPEGRARFEVMAAQADGSGMKRLSYMMNITHVGDAERLGRHAGAEMKKLQEAAA